MSWRALSGLYASSSSKELHIRCPCLVQSFPAMEHICRYTFPKTLICVCCVPYSPPPTHTHTPPQAIRLDPKEPLAHLGTAQVYLAASGEVANVVSELELVLQTLPGGGGGVEGGMVWV